MNITELRSFSHEIPLSQAIEMTKRFRDNQQAILKEEYKGKGILPICETFSNDAFKELMAQPGCVALRFYMGMNEKKDIKFLIVGVNDKDEDILPSNAKTTKTATTATAATTTMKLKPTTGKVMDEGNRCPPTCPPDSPLNHNP